jgi:hypothetical protein
VIAVAGTGTMTRVAGDRYNPFIAHEQAMDAAVSRIGPARRSPADRETEQIVTEEFFARGTADTAEWTDRQG